MQKDKTNCLLHSASDLVHFLLCPSIVVNDLVHLETPLQKAEDDGYTQILQEKGLEHEQLYLDHLKNYYTKVVEIDPSIKNEEAFEKTRSAMASGADIIFQACLMSENRIGHIDFLEKVDSPSRLGSYSYEITDTKLSKTALPKYMIQLCFYADLLEFCQGVLPETVHLKLGDGRKQSFWLSDYYAYYKIVKSRYDTFLSEKHGHYPTPCDYCGYCDWKIICDEKWMEDDHLSLVADINKIQIKKLEQAGVNTLESLATLPDRTRIPKMNPSTLETLKKQAGMQLKHRKTGENFYKLLPVELDVMRGFNRLPLPDQGDLYFDMEGDPMEQGGLEYLFGVYFIQNGQPVFKDFRAFDRKSEKAAFESFIDFVWDHLKVYPDAHIYHYAHYEETALKKLMSLHGVREFQVDELLRNHKLVDLYKVVKQGMIISESSYSIKKLENFYMEKRDAEVVNATESIVFFEKWKKTRDPALIDSIRDYNKDDCRSTYLLHQWLLSIKPEASQYFYDQCKDSESEKLQGTDIQLSDYELRLNQTAEKLVSNLPENMEDWSRKDHLYSLTAYLLDFYRRADKPSWWSIFSRMGMTQEELIEDPECIGNMELPFPPHVEKRSYVYTYEFPEQEYKLREGQNCTRTDTGQNLSKIIFLDMEKNQLQLKLGVKREPLPRILSIGPGKPIDNFVLREALFRFAESLINGDRKFQAVEHLLKIDLPEFKNITYGEKIIQTTGKDLIEESIQAVNNLNHSYLSIQGPPGTGKTYTAAHIILGLLKEGKSIGISSNSHKAINNLLYAVEKYSFEKNVIFSGTKKSSFFNSDSFLNGRIIKDVTRNEDVSGNIVGATAWYFANEDNDQKFDYLFVDEAGQVSLANITAMGLCAKNIVLLGDQMQLGQPIQGTHPGDSGKSILDYLMADHATVPENQGIFLPKTYRMHQDISRFISDTFYNGRLTTKKQNNDRRLILEGDRKLSLPETGIKFIPSAHEGCSQFSLEEAEIIEKIIDYLLDQSYLNKTNEVLPINLENILIVAPYNMQVNLLQKQLPDGARVGTVDKFQGQEAEIVIISMTTSSQEFMPRYVDFLFSKKRLNVSLSRARCLSLLIANPQLLETSCKTLDQMSLINTLCLAYYEGRPT